MNAMVSVIVPVYNVQPYLVQCVESIIKQTYRNLEIVLIDDGSSDDSGLICEKYKELDKRIIVIHNENGGLSKARNCGLDNATGEYITFVDSDDWISENYIEALYTALEKTNADISCCGRYIALNGEIKGERFSSPALIEFSPKMAIKEVLKSRRIDVAMWDKMYKRELFDEIRFPIGMNNEDIAVFYKLFHKSKKIVHCGQSCYYYRIREGSISRSKYSRTEVNNLLYILGELEAFLYDYYPTLITSYYSYRGLHLYANLAKISNKDKTMYYSDYHEMRMKFNNDYKYLLFNNGWINNKKRLGVIATRLGLYSFLNTVRNTVKATLL